MFIKIKDKLINLKNVISIEKEKYKQFFYLNINSKEEERDKVMDEIEGKDW
jgi:hypothetical protein